MSSQGLLAFYKLDGFDNKKNHVSRKPKPRWCEWTNSDSRWRRNALAYYKGNSNDHEDAPPNSAWCHITGTWHQSEFHKAEHIVPFCRDDNGFGELLFGGRAQSLQRAGNALLLSDRIKRLFDSHHMVVVPVNAMEKPITRWRTEVISPDIQNGELIPDFFWQGSR